jgi:hypothetical protein
MLADANGASHIQADVDRIRLVLCGDGRPSGGCARRLLTAPPANHLVAAGSTPYSVAPIIFNAI